MVIAGTGPKDLLDVIKGMCAPNDDVVFTGRLTKDDLSIVMDGALCFVLPSVLEGLPVALIEALSHDLRVVISDLPENLEVVNDRGKI